ncbi:MAG: Glycosyl transferase family 39 [Candidatus Amesbacteria bacterium GW2011_GWC1_48_10]|uniref:Glycosyl transferase family 39 n=1 Tax=Candidatus Amesbacteria bacterium GW2011_GWC1_48_10 TaxID=1618365 RepID=A0A0G1UI67_9BACT|nr:MAG: Glycosyl transferase family 39 [Candidatus Amesbacteria bacterium GW2011_GWC1_48_10]
MTNSQIKVEIQKSKTGFIGGVTVVLVVALAVRVIGLGKYPVSMGIDEIANAYNAYSLLTTGHDEWGKVLPVTLRSFNDYKPPVNIYLIVPSIAFFGKTEAAVRLPTAVLGALTAVVWAVWVRRWGMGRGVAIAAGLGLALSPWHINYSRATFEAVTALFLVLTGVTLFQRWEKGGGKAWAAGAAAMLGLSMWTYHAERLFVPVLVIYICSGTGSDGDTAYVSGDVYTGGGDAGGGHFLAEGKVIGEDIASGKLRKYLGTSVGQ